MPAAFYAELGLIVFFFMYDPDKMTTLSDGNRIQNHHTRLRMQRMQPTRTTHQRTQHERYHYARVVPPGRIGPTVKSA